MISFYFVKHKQLIKLLTSTNRTSEYMYIHHLYVIWKFYVKDMQTFEQRNFGLQPRFQERAWERSCLV